LDPRPPEVSRCDPWHGAVNIPLAEIKARVLELPAPGSTILVPDDDLGRQAAEILVGLRRIPSFGIPSPGNPGDRLWAPNPFLMEFVAARTPGTAIDLGCGVGREAVALRNLGWQVTAVDALPDAIARGRELEHRYATGPHPIEWRVQKLTDTPPGGPYDLALMGFFYRPELLATAPKWLNPNGAFVLEVFSDVHFARFGKPKNAPTPEAILAATSLRCEKVTNGEASDRFTVRAVFRMPSD